MQRCVLCAARIQCDSGEGVLAPEIGRAGGGGHMGACGLQLSLWLLPTCGLKAAVREADCVPLCCAVLCVCCVIRYKHMDMADLEAQLQAADAAGTRVKLIATGEGGGWSCQTAAGTTAAGGVRDTPTHSTAYSHLRGCLSCCCCCCRFALAGGVCCQMVCFPW